MAANVIINASPLIILSRSQHLGLLKDVFANEVWIPGQVYNEIMQRGPNDITARSIAHFSWLIPQPVQNIPESVLKYGLDVGESSVIAMSLSHHKTDVMIDDSAGRKCACDLGIQVLGTLGLVIIAKKQGIIPYARPVINDMLKTGLYLSDEVINKALAKIGE